MKVDWHLVRLLCHQKLLREDLTVTQATRDAEVSRLTFSEFLAGTRPALAVHNLLAVLGWLGIHDWREICESPGGPAAAELSAVPETGMADGRGGQIRVGLCADEEGSDAPGAVGIRVSPR